MPIGGAVAVIPAGLGLGIPPAGLVAFILFTDANLALFLVWNFDYAKKIPGLGKVVERAEENGEKAIKKYKWAKRFGFLGLVLFVMFPLQYTGSAIGAVAGRLIGMTPLMTWLAVVAGCFLRSTLTTLIFFGRNIVILKSRVCLRFIKRTHLSFSIGSRAETENCMSRPGWQSGQMRWPRESLSRKGRSGSNPDPGAFYNHKITQIFTRK